MTSTSQNRPQQQTRRHDTGGRAGEPTGWASWVVFAGVMLMLASFFQIIEGLVALFDDKYFVGGPTV